MQVFKPNVGTDIFYFLFFGIKKKKFLKSLIGSDYKLVSCVHKNITIKLKGVTLSSNRKLS